MYKIFKLKESLNLRIEQVREDILNRTQQYGQLVKYATGLRLGTADTEDILRRFNCTNVQHPVYRALSELGKAVKTVFLCRYLHSMELRREINEGLNIYRELE